MNGLSSSEPDLSQRPDCSVASKAQPQGLVVHKAQPMGLGQVGWVQGRKPSQAEGQRALGAGAAGRAATLAWAAGSKALQIPHHSPVCTETIIRFFLSPTL